MTKIVNKLPVSAERLKVFRDTALKKMITNSTAKLEENFVALCAEFTKRFNADEWVKMQNKDVFYINDIFAIMPNLYNFDSAGNSEYNSYSIPTDRLKFHGFDGDLLTENEVKKCFNDRLDYFRYSDGGIAHSDNGHYRGLSFKENGSYKYMYTYNNRYKGVVGFHSNRCDSDTMLSIPIFRFGEEDNPAGTAAQAILKWLEFDLLPEKFETEQTKNIFGNLKNLYAKYKDYLKADSDKIIFDQDKIISAVYDGTEFDFLPDAKNLLSATEIEASEDFVNVLKDELLNGDKVRADLDAYDENILTDPNRGHWDLWDFGEGEDKAGEIILPEGLTARNPEDDINHGIVAIDFGTKSTVVVYENERLQILPLQVGNGNYGKGVHAKNYENPTVIQFINLGNFVEAYNARSGRPKTKWDDVTVSHTAFENLTNSDSKHYYSFLTELKNWCGTNNRIKIIDGNGRTEDLPPFMELLDGDINPLEYYAYYLGLYINNMLQEKRIFLNYIMSFPVTYDKDVRERMRSAFARGIKKSLPTALLSNNELRKKFKMQDGVSEPAAYAITALQEYNFDPEGEEEFYYSVFDFGGGTTDFDFGVFRESDKDRYDYSLIHFGENGDKTLGGENLLKLLAFEVFKANQERLLKPEEGKNVGKIPFTFAAEKKDFVGSAALIKDSQEAHLNMHNLAEKLRPVWEEPDSQAAQDILSGNTGIEVTLTTDKGEQLTNFVLHTAFEGYTLDLKKILRDRIEQGIKNFFIAMREAFIQGNNYEDYKIKMVDEIEEVSIFLAGNSSKSQLVTEIFAEYIEENKGKKLQEIFNVEADKLPHFKIYPALGTEQAKEIQATVGVEVSDNPAAPTGKTGVAFGLLKCRDSGNIEITHITPTENKTAFQFYVGRNKKRKFKTVIDKTTRLEKWYQFIDASNDFDILYSDLPEAKDDSMDVTKAKRINVHLDNHDANLFVFLRAIKSNVIEYAVAEKIEDLIEMRDMPEPVRIELD